MTMMDIFDFMTSLNTYILKIKLFYSISWNIFYSKSSKWWWFTFFPWVSVHRKFVISNHNTCTIAILKNRNVYCISRDRRFIPALSLYPTTSLQLLHNELTWPRWSQDHFSNFCPSFMALWPWLMHSIYLGASVCLQHWQSRHLRNVKNLLHDKSLRQPVTSLLCPLIQ